MITKSFKLNKFYLITFGLLILLTSFFIPLTFASFGDIGLGARPMGMGGSFCAVADDANAIFWNPAGLPYLKNLEFSSTYLNFYGLDVTSQLISGVGRFSSIGIGLGLLRTGETGLYIEDNLSVPLGVLLSDSFAETIGFEHLAIGVTPKYLRKSYEGYDEDNPIFRYGSSTGVLSFDAGVLGEYKRFRLGFMVENLLNPDIALNVSDEMKLPRLYRLGIVLDLDIKGNSFKMSADGVRRDIFTEAQDSIRAGLEFQLNLVDAFRPVIRLGTWADKEMNNLKFFAGMGLGVGPVQIDYALNAVSSHETLGHTHRFSVSAALGNIPPSLRPPFNRGKEAFNKRDYEAAIPLLLEVIKDDDLENAEEARKLLGSAYWKLGKEAYEKEDYQTAISKLRKAINEQPENTEARELLDSAQLKQYVKELEMGNYEAVISQLHQKIIEQPENAMAYKFLCLAYWESEQKTKAFETMKCATYINPQISIPDEILKYSEKLIKDNYTKYFRAGMLAKAKKDYKTAIQQWKLALLWSYSNERTTRKQISTAYTKWLSEEFKTTEQRQTVIETEQAWNLLRDGYKNYLDGKIDLALEKFEESLTLDKSLTEAYKWIGCIYALKGKKKDAEMAFQKALSLHADLMLIGDVPEKARKLFAILKIRD